MVPVQHSRYPRVELSAGMETAQTNSRAKGEDEMKLALYCICGAAWMPQVNRRNIYKQQAMEQAWSDAHTGPGHSPCDAKTAARARTKMEREEERKAK